MPKIKFTKGELKRQRDALKQYQRYLPTLQLKKQQLQMEILHQMSIYEQKMQLGADKKKNILNWAGFLVEPVIDLKPWLRPEKIITTARNIAGVDLAVFERAEFSSVEYDLFIIPLWVDIAVDALREMISLRQEIKTIEDGIALLRNELRITNQRVNLFEKIKIPQAEEAIRLIKIYLGDQLANAVGRSKIAKRKIEALLTQEVLG